MNMAIKGVSGWLTVAAAYAMLLWVGIAEAAGAMKPPHAGALAVRSFNAALQPASVDGAWFARGITDNNVPPASSQILRAASTEPAVLAMLSGAASPV